MKKKEELVTLRVNRSTWDRGKSSSLYNDGSHCILGEYMHTTLGLSNELLKDASTPSEVADDLQRKKGGLLQGFCPLVVKKHDTIRDSALADKAMEINDDEDLTDAVREARLERLFKRLGVALEFFGK